LNTDGGLRKRMAKPGKMVLNVSKEIANLLHIEL